MHQLIIEARDGDGIGSLSDRATINIEVLNVNEHRPTFIMPALPNATVEVTEVPLNPKHIINLPILAGKLLNVWLVELRHNELLGDDRESHGQRRGRERQSHVPFEG